MPQDYLPVLLQILIAIGFAIVVLALSVIVGRSAKRNKVKDTAYECGMLPIGEGAPRFSVKFYLVAMLFVIFDIEVVFMYPWAVQFRDLLANGAEQKREIIRDYIIIHLDGISTDDIAEPALSYLMSELLIPNSIGHWSNTLGRLATERFVSEVLIPSARGASDAFLGNLRLVLTEAGRRHAKRYFLPSD